MQYDLIDSNLYIRYAIIWAEKAIFRWYRWYDKIYST